MALNAVRWGSFYKYSKDKLYNVYGFHITIN